MKLSPDQFKPQAADQLIGLPAASATALLRHALNLKSKPDPTLKLMLYGEPGCGKTTIAELLAEALAGHRTDIESVNGRNLTIEVVRQWQSDARYISLFNGWKVKIINEADIIPGFAQDLMLSYLDELPGRTAVIATSNEYMENLSDRFATRFGRVKIDSPTEEEIQSFLRNRWHLKKEPAAFIAQGCNGNVRDALMRAANYLAIGTLDTQPPRTAKPAPSSSGSEAALKSWDTRRRNATANSAN